MARSCTVCGHPERAAVERQLVSGASLRDVAGRTRLARSSLARHLAAHLPATVKEESTARDVQRASSLRERLEDLYERAEAILAETERAGRHNVSLSSIRELRNILALAGKLAGLPAAEPVTIRLSFSDGTRVPERRPYLEALPNPDDEPA